MLVKNILLCEDIRQELGNKFSLMGVVGSSINIDCPPGLPKDVSVPISIAFMISIENTDINNDPRGFVINTTMFLEENKLADMSAKVESLGDDTVYNIPFPKIGISVTKTSKFSVHVQILRDSTLISEGKATLGINVIRHQ